MTRAIGVLLSTLAACSAEHVQTVHLPVAVEHPVTPLDASLLPPPSAKTIAHACVMLYECGCNSRCIEIDHPPDSLAAGMQVSVASGPFRGTKVFVARNRADDGTPVFTVQHADPKDPIIVCGVPNASPLVGYICGMSNLGPARACTSCDMTEE